MNTPEKPEPMCQQPVHEPTHEDKVIAYQTAIQNAVLCARLLKDIDIPKLLESIDKAEAFGCFVDPTLYRQKQGAMREDKDLLKAALPLWNWAKAVEARMALAQKEGA